MVKRCKNGQCVDHPQSCLCDFCKEVEGESVVVTEQGMFAELTEEYELATDPSYKRTK